MNPRDPFGSNGFQDRRLQPLGHSSVFNCNLIWYLAERLVTVCKFGLTAATARHVLWKDVRHEGGFDRSQELYQEAFRIMIRLKKRAGQP